MKRLTRIATLFALPALSFLYSYAGESMPQPKYNFNHRLVPDSVLAAGGSVTTTASKNKLCSCQVLSLDSRNYQHKEVLILAERTNNGDLIAGYAAAQKRIEREKRYLAATFYDKVRKTKEINSYSDCTTLYRKLKDTDSHLRLYDILDADIHRLR
ncbi:MAG: hypothetical protein QM664_03390 [Flavihumibacter sp.]